MKAKNLARLLLEYGPEKEVVLVDLSTDSPEEGTYMISKSSVSKVPLLDEGGNELEGIGISFHNNFTSA
jgi:hypothetical protein